MNLRRTKTKAEKLVTKPVTMRPALIKQVVKLAAEEDRTFSQMSRILIEEALDARQSQQPETLAQANQV